MSAIDQVSLRNHDLSGALVGRKKKLERLKRTLDLVSSENEARAVSLVGPAGVGKTRIVEEFLGEAGSGLTGLRVYRTQARQRGLSYGVFSRLLRARLGIGDEVPEEQALRRVTVEVARVLDDHDVDDVCFFLGQLMGLSFPASPLTRALGASPGQAQALRGAVIRRFFEADARQGPLVLFFDNLHLADADSLDLLEELISEAEGSLLIVCAGGRELLGKREDWGSSGASTHELIELESLSGIEAAQLIKQMLSRCSGGTPDALIDAAVQAAGGNPGQLVQMVRSFFDAGVLEEIGQGGESWRVNLDRLSAMRLPMSVDEAVALRISALSPEERTILEHAAAMGSVFWLGGLVSLARMGRPAPALWSNREKADLERISQVLKRLVERDYLLGLDDAVFPEEQEFVFRHNFEREKISSLTSAAAARRYHQTVADWLSQKNTARSEEEYTATLAEHLEKAGSITRSAFTFLDAGDIARRNFALRKATEYYERGLTSLGDDDARRRIDALHDYGDVLVLLGKTDQAMETFRQMLAIAYQMNLLGKGGAAHNRIGRLFRETGRLADAGQHLAAARELFHEVGDKRGVAASIDDMGKLLWMRGEYDAALKEMRTALDMRRELGDRRSIALSLNNIGLVWMDHGRPVQAKEALEASLAMRREINDPVGVADSLNTLGSLSVDQNQFESALNYFREAHSVLVDIGERKRITESLTHIGQTLARLGKGEEAIEILEEAERASAELGDKLQLAEAKRGLAKSYLLKGEMKKSRRYIRDAVDLFAQVRSKAHLAIALRTLGEVTGAGAWGKQFEGKAVEYFMRSIAMAKEIGNEVEVARSYLAFSGYVTATEGFAQNGEIQREAVKLKEMAAEIFERHRIESAPLIGE
ncbi:MAG: tetratricopeptide repeat protein [Polyangiaceae bacterium]|nr:tetratricopeptide repeat protein [Polyangiaceae bacterium]